MYRLILIAAAALVLQGCATKHYGRQGNVTSYERNAMTCREIDLEIAKVDGFIYRVHQEGSFDAKTVLGFLGDFGIGNGMEKRAALQSAQDRKGTLTMLKEQKCPAPA